MLYVQMRYEYMQVISLLIALARSNLIHFNNVVCTFLEWNYEFRMEKYTAQDPHKLFS